MVDDGAGWLPKMASGKGNVIQGAYRAPLILHMATARGSMSWPDKHNEKLLASARLATSI